MSAESGIKPAVKPSARSRVSNGRDLFCGQHDGRTMIARRYRDLLAQISSDLGDNMSEAQVQLARRAVTLCIWAEQVEAALAAGEPLDIGSYSLAANALRRLLGDLGLERKRLRDVTPSLRDIIEGRRG